MLEVMTVYMIDFSVGPRSGYFYESIEMSVYNFLFQAADYLIDLFTVMFPDSKLALTSHANTPKLNLLFAMHLIYT